MRTITLTAIAFGVLLCPSAFAQPEAQGTEQVRGEEPKLSPPRLTSFRDPKYPEAERQQGRSASVGLVMTVGVDGKVTDAQVVESAGENFDRAALTAAQQLVFEPARSGDTKIAAKIPFRFEFKAEPVAEPAAGAPAQAAAPDPSNRKPEPKPATKPTKEPRTESPATRVADLPAIEIDVEGERPVREVTRRELKAEEIQKLPGTNGDALRAVQNLPGVGRPPGLDGLLIVRGSSPRDTQVFVDGVNVPIAYHFGGLSSVIPSEMLDHIDFYPGSFGPEYGRASGGIVDVGVRSPRSEGFGGLAQVDMLDARVLAEGAITEDTRFLIGARRSWLDAWLKPVVENSGVSVTAAPVYYDAQALIEHDITRDTKLRLFAYGSDDRFKLLLSSPYAGDPAEGGDLSQHTRFWRTEARLTSQLSDSTRWTTSLSTGQDNERVDMGGLNLDVNFQTLDARSELRSQLTHSVALTGGVDIQTSRYDVSWRLPALDFESQDNGPIFGRPVSELQGDGYMFRPGAYLAAEVSPVRGLKLLPSIRSDYTHDTSRWTADPRLAVRYDVFSGSPRTTLKAGAGVFHQPPEPYEDVEPFGSPGVKSERAEHYSLGVEQELGGPLELSVEGFYKDLDNLVVAVPAARNSQTGIEYENLGSGRSYGSEFLLRYKPEGRFFGWLAYTLSRSERKDSPDSPYHLFEYDQTHILTALGSMKLGWGMQLGARFRYVSGSPYTPNEGGVMDYDAGVYSPVAGTPYSGRLPAFHQLDVRVDKTWDFQAWRMTAYLDVQNAYNHKNGEGVSYNYNYSKSESQTGLPLLPIVGIRGEL